MRTGTRAPSSKDPVPSCASSAFVPMEKTTCTWSAMRRLKFSTEPPVTSATAIWSGRSRVHTSAIEPPSR